MATSTDDFFRSRLDQMIDLRHPLAVLASRMPWQEIEASLSHRFARAAKAGKQIEDFDLFGPAAVVLSAGGVSKAGRPRLPLRLLQSSGRRRSRRWSQLLFCCSCSWGCVFFGVFF